MAKKKTKFNKATFKNGVLSYNYLGGEAGKGKGAVSIIKKGDDWFFADKSGKIRKDVGSNGKLTPVHMQNLRDDGIFDAAKVNPDTGKELTKAEIKAGPDLGTPGSGGSVTGSGDLPGASGGGLPLTDRSNLQLAPTDAVRPEMGVSSNTQAAVVPQVAPDRISGVGSSFSDMASGNVASVSPASDGTFTTSNFGGGRVERVGENTAGALSGQGNKGPGIYEFAPSEMPGPATGNNLVPPTPVMAVSSDPGTQTWSGMASAGPPSVEIQSTGFGGRPETPVGDNVFNTTQDSTTPDIPDKKDSPWGASDWSAVGSVMKGVGGLASAWTGVQNYKLARDAYNTQKNQWQADYNQRLKAYEDNKALANQEIDAKNRVLAARGQGTATGKGALIKQI